MNSFPTGKASTSSVAISSYSPLPETPARALPQSALGNRRVSQPSNGTTFLRAGLALLSGNKAVLSSSQQLEQAVKKGDTTQLEALIEQTPSLLHHIDAQGNNLLGQAAQGGHIACMKTLLHLLPAENIARQLKTAEKSGENPLTLAVKAGHLNIVQLLCDSPHVDVNLANSQGQTPLHVAVSNRQDQIAALLLIDPRVAANLPDHKGNTPLHVAAAHKNNLLIKLISDSPLADINARNAEGHTVLDVAINKKNTRDVLLTLLNNPNIDTSLADKNGNTQLHKAIKQDNPEVFYLLADRQNLVNHRNHAGESPLELAIDALSPFFIKALLKNSEIDANSPDQEGITPIRRTMNFLKTRNLEEEGDELGLWDLQESLAVLAGSDKINFSLQDGAGEVPLTAMAGLRNLSFPKQSDGVVAYLLHHMLQARKDLQKPDNFEIHAVNRRNETPMDVSRRVGNDKVFKTLMEFKAVR